VVEGFHIVGEVVVYFFSRFLDRSWKLAQTFLVKFFGSKDLRKLLLMASHFILSTPKASRLSHQD
jgi:hypothetical protein